MTLYESLIAKGLSPEDATSIASEHGEPSVDTDALAKSLDGLRDTFSQEGAAADYVAHLEAQVEEAASITDAVSKGADLLLEEHKAQNDAISKALLAVGEELRALRADYSTLSKSIAGDSAAMKKSLGIVTEQLDEPIIKSVSSSVVPSPLDAQPAGGARSDVINKALQIMQSPDSDVQRVESMQKAISLLESHGPVDQIVREYQIN